MLTGTKRIIFLSLGLLTTLLGFIGIFLPLLPTTPFLLLSAYFFSKSSETLHNWLINHKIFGPIIRDWRMYGIIRKRAKIISMILIVILFGYTMIFVKVKIIIKAVVLLIGLSVSTFIVTRPSEISKKLVDEIKDQ